MGWVMDCSIAGALGLPDEGSETAERFLAVVEADTEIWVPALWWYEIGNVIVAALRRRRLTDASAARLAELYASLPVRTDGPPTPAIAAETRRIALQYGLSAYDATYLELALRLGIGLATLDRDLERAAAAAGVHLVKTG